MTYTFDRPAFRKALITYRVIDRNLSLRIAADEAKLSPATLSRCEKGNKIELQTFLNLCNWLKIRPDKFLVSK